MSNIGSSFLGGINAAEQSIQNDIASMMFDIDEEYRRDALEQQDRIAKMQNATARRGQDISRQNTLDSLANSLKLQEGNLGDSAANRQQRAKEASDLAGYRTAALTQTTAAQQDTSNLNWAKYKAVQEAKAKEDQQDQDLMDITKAFFSRYYMPQTGTASYTRS